MTKGGEAGLRNKKTKGGEAGLRNKKTKGGEAGQATVEYILMVSAAVVFALLVFKGFVQPVYKSLQNNLVAQIQGQLNPATLYHFPISQ